MNGDHSSEWRVGRRELIRRIGVGGAVAATGLAGVTTQAAASHKGKPTIHIPGEQTALNHPRFDAVIKISEAYLPEGGYISVEDTKDENVSGESIVNLPAGHFRNSSVAVQIAPEDKDNVNVKATILKDNRVPYENGKVTDRGIVNF